MTDETVNLKRDQQKSSNLKNREKKRFKNTDRLLNLSLWDNTKRTNTHVIVVPKREQKKTCEGTMSENFQNLALTVNLQIQKSQ